MRDEQDRSAAEITYHVRRDDDGVYALIRMQESAEGRHAELYRPGDGWVEDRLAWDVIRNGQDYDLVDAAEAHRAAQQMDAEPD